MVVGQKVVCVDDQFPDWVLKHYAQLPVKDVVYVIRQMQVGISAEGEEGAVCLYLIGLSNPKSTIPPYRERGFNSERFVPLMDETDEITKDQEDKNSGELVMVSNAPQPGGHHAKV
jgi:hypothetical protein